VQFVLIGVVYGGIFVVVRSSGESLLVGIDHVGIVWDSSCPWEISFSSVVHQAVD
jgi:hypothetical protein